VNIREREKIKSIKGIHKRKSKKDPVLIGPATDPTKLKADPCTKYPCNL
jgi:hypothetical protein